MGRKRYSVGEILKRTKSPDERLAIAHTWADEWHIEHFELIKSLKAAIDARDMDRIRMILATLRTLTDQKHRALHNIFNRLAEHNPNVDWDD